MGGDKRSWVGHTKWRSGAVKGLMREDSLRILVSGLQSHKIEWMVREMRSGWVGGHPGSRRAQTPNSEAAKAAVNLFAAVACGGLWRPALFAGFTQC